jgi:Transferrin receptor-like dimerisation domain/Peptidase family M28/PA domain
MGDEKDSQRYESLPIPSYEEATSSRPTSSHSRLGPEEVSDDAERQGLLRYPQPSQTGEQNGYQPPTAESARSSLDLLPSGDGSERGSTEGLRLEMEQLEVEEADNDNGSHRSLLTNRFSKRITSFTNSLSSLNLSFRRYIPSFSIPRIRPSTWTSAENHRIVILGRLFGAFLIVSVAYLLIASDVLSIGTRRTLTQVYDPEKIRAYIQNHINENGKIQEYLEYLTRDVHVAGTKGNLFYAEWIKDLFELASLKDVALERFDVYLNYPQENGRRIAIVHPPESVWQAALEEDATSQNRQQTYSPVFHGHSKAGNVTGPLIYANYGSRDDFEWLKSQGISLDGAIALVRYGGTQGDRALKVKAAELAGAAGCVTYSDPQTEGELWPNGRFMPIDGVQRGTVSLMSWVVGDVLSPGWASIPDDDRRLAPGESTGLVKIPSLPISWRDAKHLLQALQGRGKEVPSDWQGGSLTTTYWTGDRDSPSVNLMNMQDEGTREPIYNVLGRIPGWEQMEKKVIVGNHRDAWCVGAADPGSGTAIMLEVVRIFGELVRDGWVPLRTIEFASWDGEEYNLIGSTEHVENRQDELRRDGVAYINVDVGVSGTEFWAAASPLYERALLRVLDRTSDPVTNRTLRDLWDTKKGGLEGLGAGSDYVAFQDIVGTSSIDFGFRGQSFPYHSCYDNYEWMTKFGDPTFDYHTLMGQVWALLIFELANKPILPFDLGDYAKYFERYVNDLADYARAKAEAANAGPDGSGGLNLKVLQDVAANFTVEAQTFHDWDRSWTELVFATGGIENNVMAIKRMGHNNRMANFESHLLDLEEGGGVSCFPPSSLEPGPLLTLSLQLQNRTQFKHVLFAPQTWSGYEEAIFPSIRDAVDVGDWNAAQEQVNKVADIVARAVHKLNHN